MKKLFLGIILFLTTAVFSNAQCYVLNDTPSGDGYEITTSSKEISFVGNGQRLRFEASRQTGSITGTITVEQYVNDSWISVATTPKLSTSWGNFYEWDIDRHATRLKFTRNGTLKRYIRNISVTQAYYLETAATSFDFDDAAGHITETFSVDYSTPSGFSATCDNANFTISPANFGTACSWGTENMVVNYTPTSLGTHSGTLTITDGTTTKHITLSGQSVVQAPQLFVDSLTYTTMPIHWQSVPGATGYEVQLLQNGSTVASASTTNTMYLFTGLVPSTEYEVQVCALFSSIRSTYSIATATTPSLTPVPMLATDVESTAFTACWQPLPNVDGYRLTVVLHDGTVWLNDQNVSTNSYRLTGLPEGAVCHYTVKAYVGETTSSASDAIVTTLPKDLPLTLDASTGLVHGWVSSVMVNANYGTEGYQIGSKDNTGSLTVRFDDVPLNYEVEVYRIRNTLSAYSAYPNIYVQTSTDGTTWTTVETWAQENPTGGAEQSKTMQLGLNAHVRYLRVLRTPATGEYALIPLTDGRAYVKRLQINAASNNLVFDNASGDNQWSNTANWAPHRNMLPRIYDAATIAAPVVITTADATARQLTIAAGGSLTIAPQAALKVDTLLQSSTATVLLQSSPLGTGSLLTRGDAPMATVQMYSKVYSDTIGVDDKWNWQYFGSPVTQGTVASANSLFNGAWMYGWNENGWVVTNNAYRMEPFMGHAITQVDVPSGVTYTYAGKLNNTNQTLPLAYTEGATYKGFNLLANSYAAPIDISRLSLSSFVNAEATVYVFNTGSYSDWAGNPNVGLSPGQYMALPVRTVCAMGDEMLKVLPPMQGFFVQATAPGSLTLHYDTLVWQGLQPNAPLRVNAQADDLLGKLVLRVQGTRYADKLYLLRYANCSHSFDNGYDGSKQFGSSAAPQIFATEADGYMAVNAIDTLEGQYIGFRAGENDSYTLTVSVQSDEMLYLHDMEAQTVVPLTEGATYNFTATGLNDHRFLVSASPVGNWGGAPTHVDAVLAQGQLLLYGSVLHAVNNDEKAQIVRLYDAQGRLLVEQTVLQQFDINIATLPQGVYVARMGTQVLKLVR